MSPEQPGTGPTVLRILIGSQLRRLREEMGISREDAGYQIRASGSKISRMELGRVGFKERDVADLLTFYGVEGDDDSREAMLSLVRQANEPGWWQRFGDLLPTWFSPYVGLEEAASRIRTYEVQFVPGLLQTEDYMRAVIRTGAPSATEEEVERRVSLRVMRQKLLNREQPPVFWAVIDEAALRRAMGGPRVMRPQLQRLIDMAQSQNITIQVMPFQFGGHRAEAGAFTLLRFPEPDLPDVVYLEQLTTALYLDKRDDVDRYTEAMERLCIDSTKPGETLDTLHSIMKEF